MPKTLSTEIDQNLISQYGGGAWFPVCEIAIPGYTTQYLARNTEDVSYDGHTYTAHNLDVGNQVFSGDGSVPQIILRVFQDRNRVIEDMINETQGAEGASVKIIKVCGKFLDTPIPALEADYDLIAAESDAEWVTLTLGIPNPLTQVIPLRNQSCSQCPYATPTLFTGPECQYVGIDTTCTGTLNDCIGKGNEVHWGAEIGLDPNGLRV